MSDQLEKVRISLLDVWLGKDGKRIFVAKSEEGNIVIEAQGSKLHLSPMSALRMCCAIAGSGFTREEVNAAAMEAAKASTEGLWPMEGDEIAPETDPKEDSPNARP